MIVIERLLSTDSFWGGVAEPLRIETAPAPTSSNGPSSVIELVNESTLYLTAWPVLAGSV